jgi:YidC/Oxa1 family membrane protein insertase
LGLWHSYVDFIEWCLGTLRDYTGSTGLAIIIFTVILKTILLPLTVKSIRSTAGMQELQPKMKELQKKYKDDRQRLSQEMMQLYAQYQINPAAGCLPLLIQIPIFFGLYFAVREISTDDTSFLWLHLNQADPYKILPILAGVFQFVQTRMMRPANGPKVTDPQQQMMNTMTNFMPLMVVVFGWTFASGAVLYWLTQSIYSVIQQWFITGWGSMKVWFPFLDKLEMPEHRRLGYRKPVDPKTIDVNAQPKGFMARMQQRAMDAERAQQERMGNVTGTTTAAKPTSTSGANTGTGKRAKQSRAQGTQRNVNNVSGPSEDDLATETGPAASPGTSSRVMTGRQSAASRKGRGRGGS